MMSIVAATLVVELITALINELLYMLSVILCRVLDVLYEVFEVFAGIKPVTYSGGKAYILDIFLGNSVINALFKGMAVIGIAMTFAFAIAAVIKKTFDSTGEKVKATYGMILGNIFKAILLILLMTAIVSATIDATGILMTQIDYIFDNSEELADPSEIAFDDQDFATMFRIIDTIGNYSLNPSYNNRYNINACYNAIRSDMQLLDKNGAFRFTYDLTDESKNSWQYALLQIYNAGDIYAEHTADEYDEVLTKAILACMESIQTNASFKPLSYYYRGYTKSSTDVPLGKILMMSASLEAARNSSYNTKGSIHDNLRHPYLTGEKNAYKMSQIKSDFWLEIGKWHHVVPTLAAWMFIKEFIKMIINCCARIFNMILLYITSPPFIAVMPLDDGGKVKQWTTAFLVQSLSIFGSFIAVRLAMVFIPVIMSSEMTIFTDSSIKDLFAKIVMVISIISTAEKASGMITGILTDNAGYQSVMAGDVGSGLMQKGAAVAGKALAVGLTAAKAVGGMAMKEAKLGGKAVADATGLSKKFGDFTGGIKNKFTSMREKGGFKAAKASGWKTSEQEGQEKAAKAEKEDKAFKSSLLDKIGAIGQTPEQKQKSEKAAEKKKKDDNNASMRGTKSKDDYNQQGKGSKKLDPHGMNTKAKNEKTGHKDDFNVGAGGKRKLSLDPPPELERQKPKPLAKSSKNSKKNEKKPAVKNEAKKGPERASNEQAEKNGRNRSNAVYKKAKK